MHVSLHLGLRLRQIATLCLCDVASNAKNGYKNDVMDVASTLLSRDVVK